ncbi:hypothetical protein BH09VER1_BH09VER1_48190 [soil metagenome]
MKYALLAIVFALTSLSIAWADDISYAKFQNSPELKAEERAKVSISVEFQPNPVQPNFRFQIFNGLRDKTIIGFILTVFPEGTDPKDSTQNIFVPTFISPLSASNGGGNYFQPFTPESQKQKLKYAVTEIRYKPETSSKR